MCRGTSDDNNGQLSHESSGFAYSEDDIPQKTSGSLDSTDGTRDEHPNGTGDIVSDGDLWTEGFVNNSASPRVSAQLEFVNNRDSSVKNRNKNFVDNHIEDQKMGSQFGDESDEFEVKSWIFYGTMFYHDLLFYCYSQILNFLYRHGYLLFIFFEYYICVVFWQV